MTIDILSVGFLRFTPHPVLLIKIHSPSAFVSHFSVRFLPASVIATIKVGRMACSERPKSLSSLFNAAPIGFGIWKMRPTPSRPLSICATQKNKKGSRKKSPAWYFRPWPEYGNARRYSVEPLERWFRRRSLSVFLLSALLVSLVGRSRRRRVRDIMLKRAVCGLQLVPSGRRKDKFWPHADGSGRLRARNCQIAPNFMQTRESERCNIFFNCVKLIWRSINRNLGHAPPHVHIYSEFIGELQE